MAKKSYPSLAKFDLTLPKSLALRRNFNQLLDYAKNIVHSEDGLGLAYLLFTPAEFGIRFGHAPIIKVHPGPFVGTVLEQRNIQRALDTFLDHDMAKAFLIMDDIKALREDEHDSLNYCTLCDHNAALRLVL